MREDEVVKQIDDYLKGMLTEKEIDFLWAEFLRNPDYFELFKTEVIAREYFQKEIIKRDRANANILILKKLGYGIVALLVITLLFRFIAAEYTSSLHTELVTEISPHEMVTTNLYRSVDESQKQLDVTISRGFEAAISGRTEQSEEYFSAVLESDPLPDQKAVASLNYGILLFNSSDFEGASEAFETVVNTESLSPYTTEKGWWYLANSLAHLENFEGAFHAAHQAYSNGELFKEEADRLMDKLEDMKPAED